MNSLRAWYESLQQRDRRVVAIGAVVLGAIIIVAGILMPLSSAVSSALKGVQTRREDLSWMRLHAAEIRAAVNTVPPPTGESPLGTVDRTARESGLASALRGTQPSTAGGVRVQLEAAPLDAMIPWLDVLDWRYGLAIESITVDRTAAPGLANVSISFSPPRR